MTLQMPGAVCSTIPITHPLLALSAGSNRHGADLAVPSGRGFIALLEALRATGGTAPGEIVARLLNEHQGGHAGDLGKLITTGQVFGFVWRASLWIPMFQFDADNLAIKASAQRVRAELPSRWSGWSQACWFAAPSANLGDRCPADMLDTNLAEVMHLARSVQMPDDQAPVRAPHNMAAHV